MSGAPREPTDGTPDDSGNEHVERPVDRFKQTAAGSILAAGMFGLADALDWHHKQEEVEVVQEASEPVRDLDVIVDLEHPERTVAILRQPPPAEN